LWDYFFEDIRKKDHLSSICKFYSDIKARGRPLEMIAHLALQCNSVKVSIKEKYLKVLIGVNQTFELTSSIKLAYTKVTNK